MNQKHLFTFTTSVIGAFFIVLLFLFSPPQLQSLDNSLRDYLFQIRGDVSTSGDIVIVDIDEKSLAELGQWPWERNVVADLLYKLTEAGAGIIGFDIVFPEQDKTSPSYLVEKYGLPIKEPINHDLVLAEAVANTPTVLGYVFKMHESTAPLAMPTIPAIVIEKNLKNESYLLKPEGALVNLETIQSQAYSSGFFNNIPDPSGIVRSVPLVMKYQNTIYPSLALEMLRIASNSQTILVNYSDTGIDNIEIGDLKIPTNRHGQLFVNYRGGEGAFPYVSAVDVIQQRINPQLIEGKWIMIGTSATGLLDLRATPLDSAYPGVEAHASVIDNILMGDMISKPNWMEAADLILVLSVFLVSFFIFNQLNAFWLSLIAVSAFFGLYLFLDYMLFTQGLIFNILYPSSGLAFALVLSTLSSYFFETRQKNLVKSKLASKVSPAVMGEILKNERLDIMQGQTREITVFFSDLRDFTRLSEVMPNPQTLISFLNHYTTEMTEIIDQQHGTVDKFIGDAIMAYWNAPTSLENHADFAVKASLMQLAALKKLNQKVKDNPEFDDVKILCEKENIEPIRIGIGINTGEAVVGEMGSIGRSDYTVIGDAVNLGSRLESLCKYYGSTLNISNYTKEQLQEHYSLRFLDKVTVKGKAEAVEIWQVHAMGEPSGKLKQELERYHQAVKLYQQSSFDEALKIFEEVGSWPDKSNQTIYSIYIERCKYYIEHTPSDFNGIFEHQTKS